MRMFVPPVVPGSRVMDPLAFPSPRLLRIGAETLVFSISARLAVIGSLPALVIWPEAIHEAGAGRVGGNPVRAHSFRSLSPSAAFHRTWSISSVLEAATWWTNSSFASFHIRVFPHDLLFFVPWVCS